ncbi:MAG: acetoacetate--CoA ligase [Bacillota bacterium]
MRKPLWEPATERKEQTNMAAFLAVVNKKYGKQCYSYDELYEWSTTNPADFWAMMWEFGGIRSSQPYERVAANQHDMLKCRWFEGARLNFAENLLRYRDDRVAIIFKGEINGPVRVTYAELYGAVARLAASLRQAGLKVGDRVAGLMPNIPETIVAMLATTSIGAIWSSCSPDFGANSVMDRFGQIQPKILFSTSGYSYNNTQFNSLESIAHLKKEIHSIEKVVIVPYLKALAGLNTIPDAVSYGEFLSPQSNLEIDFEQLPFNHPLYILYSSGTTGIPKCIVHGAGGTLIQHLKELLLHTDLKREDKISYYTTCGWMMWNWLVSSLAIGAMVVLYDGSPFYPDPGTLFKFIEDEKISVFGTSAKYLASIEKAGIRPGSMYDLSSLKAILSTGSPLGTESFEYVYREIKKDLCLSSISGGTDIISCFALGNPTGPVYTGELQCRGLGMKVEAFDETGNPVYDHKGELVCTAPFPSMPVGFWNDPGNKQYESAYFKTYPGVWRHGDYIEIVSATGGVIIYGRSDATLNPGGVRIGTAEIYRQVETLPEILDSIVVGQDWENDVRVILFVKLAIGVELSEELVKRIKAAIRLNASPRHVPAKIIPVADIPYTVNGKKVELAVRKIIHNEPVLNKDALANPEALELFRDLPELIS